MSRTIRVDDNMHRRLQREAQRRGVSVDNLVDDALRHVLDECERTPPIEAGNPPELPVFRSGGYRVNIADRDALYEVFDAYDRDKR